MTEAAVTPAVTSGGEVPGRPTWLRRAAPVTIALGVLIVCGFTARDYGLTTDEPRYIENTRRMQAWFAGISDKGLDVSFFDESLAEGWYYARQDSKNLPLVSLIESLGTATIGRFDRPPTSHRWGNLLVLALTCSVMFVWVRQECSTTAAIVGVAALLGLPRVFAHAQLLSIDPLVASFGVLASWALWNSRRSEGWSWPVLFGVLAGIGSASKPTFWLLVLAWVAWSLLADPRRLWRAGVCLVTVAPLCLLLCMPPWWSWPFGRFFDYLDLLLNDPIGWKIDVYYLGQIYQAEFAPGLDPVPVPWHSVPWLILVTTPLWFLALLLVTVCGWVRERFGRGSDDAGRLPTDDPAATPAALEGLWLISAAVLPLVVMLPFTPAHDGTRLYRPACYFGALLAASGFHRLSFRLQLASRPRRRAVAVALLVGLAAWTTAAAHPAGLSYYNVLVGGFEGATRPVPQGRELPERRRPKYEISYWWELLDRRGLDEMQTHLPQGARLTVFPEHFGLHLLRQWGHLRKDLKLVPRRQADYILMYGRLGRLADPRTHPSASLFLHEMEPVWEHRVHGVRVAVLLRLNRR